MVVAVIQSHLFEIMVVNQVFDLFHKYPQEHIKRSRLATMGFRKDETERQKMLNTTIQYKDIDIMSKQ